MSEAIAFDTHRFVKNLTASGFTEAQADLSKWMVGALTAHAALIAGLSRG